MGSIFLETNSWWASWEISFTYSSQMSITKFIKACYWSLSQATIHTLPLNYFTINFNTILLSMSRIFQVLFASNDLSYMDYVSCPSHRLLSANPNNIWQGVQIMKLRDTETSPSLLFGILIEMFGSAACFRAPINHTWNINHNFTQKRKQNFGTPKVKKFKAIPVTGHEGP
jgi:hypothetical protein